jgi:predicted nucleic acid-binding protein
MRLLKRRRSSDGSVRRSPDRSGPSAPPALIDSNVLIYATLRGDPRFDVARELVLGSDGVWGKRFVSVQILAEMYPNLTGPNMEIPDSPEAAAEKVRALCHLPHITVLPVTSAVIERALDLCALHGVRRQRYFDAQLVALMSEYNLQRIYTENVSDFSDLVSAALRGAEGSPPHAPAIEIINPFS